MASNWDFSQSDTPLWTRKDMANKYFAMLGQQKGDGVVTRLQSQNQSKNTQTKVKEELDPGESLSGPKSPGPLADTHSEPPSPLNSDASAESLTEENTDNEITKAPFLDETLIAENNDLKAYILKTYFKRMKNFV